MDHENVAYLQINELFNELFLFLVVVVFIIIVITVMIIVIVILQVYKLDEIAVLKSNILRKRQVVKTITVK